MLIFETQVFTNFLALLQSIWGDTVGKIFILTVAGYSASYMIYSGYISWFAGGYGGLLPSQIGFTAIDFFSILPTTFVLLIESAWALIKFLAKIAFYFILLPVAAGLMVIFLISAFGIDIHTESTIFASLGYLVWSLTFSIWLFFIEPSQSRFKKYFWWFVILATIGMIVLFLSSWNNDSNKILVNIPSSQNAQSVEPNFIDEIVALVNIMLVFVSPFVIGRSLAPLALERKYLSQILALHLKKSILIPGAILEIKSTNSSKKASKSTRGKGVPDIAAEVYSFTWKQERPAYLIASFNRITALYFPPETTGISQGKMILLNNEIIDALEIEGHE